MFDTSIESMLGDLFGTSNHTTAIESSLFMAIEAEGDEDDTDAKGPIPGTDKTEDLKEDEEVIADSKAKGEESADEDLEGKPKGDSTDPELENQTEVVTGECYRLSAECAVMNVAMFAAEHYQSTEGEGWDKFKATMKKVWIKVRDFALTILRRINLLIAGDLKGYKKWAEANSKFGPMYKSSKVKMKAKVPAITIVELEKEVKNIGSMYETIVDSARSAMTTGNSKDAGVAADSIADASIDILSKKYYGNDPKAKEVTPGEFATASGLGWDSLINPNLKELTGFATESVKNSKDLLSKIDRAKELSKEAKDTIRKTSSLGTAFTNAAFWAMNQKLSGIRTVRSFAGKVVGDMNKEIKTNK